ncbi:MAG: tetraacyldisaccharide 4'-kinase [Planctomycetes bacterium]|nr:tetraacyldisaccharide 4'-kinase [Planctomycetota bacterium]
MMKILSGEKQGFLSCLVRIVLLPFLLIYFIVIYIKLLMYKFGLCRQKRVEGVRIICVGNLSSGGTGKTPAVVYLTKLLLGFSQNIAVVSRGYRKNKDEMLNDEGMLLKSIFPNVLQVQNPDRYKACCEAKDAGAETIILDDGFSHLQLARDVDIVLIDATRPFSNFELLPRGMLREPPNSLNRASAVIITRSNQVSTKNLQRLTNSVKRYSRKNVKILLAQHKPTGFQKVISEKENKHVLNSIADADFKDFSDNMKKNIGKSVFLVSGIGNPDSFRETCNETNLKIAGVKEFPDHYNYTLTDVLNITSLAQSEGAEIIVTTSKDAVKLSKLDLEQSLPIYILEIEFSLSPSEDENLKNLIVS